MKIVIGIGGVSSSGKSSITNALREHLLHIHDNSTDRINVDVFHQDDYYIETDDPSQDWECPEIIDNNTLLLHILKWKNENHHSTTKHYLHEILFVEGFLVSSVPSILEQCDFTFFLLVSKSICKERRFSRDSWIRDNPSYFEHVWNRYLHYNTNILNLSSHLLDSDNESPFTIHFYSLNLSSFYVVNANLSLSSIQSIIISQLYSILQIS